MKNYSKTKANQLSAMLLCSLVVLLSCRDDDGASSVTFTESTQNLPEGSSSEIMLKLNGVATRDYQLTVRVETNAIYGEHFVTDPAIDSNDDIFITVKNGSTSAVMKITSINNSLFDGGKFLVLRLKDSRTGLNAGSFATSTIILVDDEGPSIAGFASSNLPLPERDRFVIELPFSTPANGKGTIDIQLNIDKYGKRFSTTPEPKDGIITLLIEEGDPSAIIILNLIDNDIFEGDHKVVFSISAVSGVIQKGAVTELEVTIVDNETRSIASFAMGDEIIPEESGERVIPISLSEPAAGEGTLSLILEPPSGDIDRFATYGIDFVTIPAATDDGTIALPVDSRSTIATLKIIPIDNSSCGDRITYLRLQAGTGAVGIVDDKSIRITFKDDDIISLNFTNSTDFVDENDTGGIEVSLSFSKPAAEDAIVYYYGTGYVGQESIYGAVYQTYPEMMWEWYDLLLPLNVTAGATGSSFIVFPVDNTKNAQNYILRFSFAFSTNGCFAGNDVYALTIQDDD